MNCKENRQEMLPTTAAWILDETRQEIIPTENIGKK
jgi:hypothetical protein